MTVEQFQGRIWTCDVCGDQEEVRGEDYALPEYWFSLRVFINGPDFEGFHKDMNTCEVCGRDRIVTVMNILNRG